MKEYQCTRCRSWAVNPHLHGRLPDVDLDLCDVCYWRKRAENSIPVSSVGEGRKLKHAIKKDRGEFAAWLDSMLLQGLAKQTKVAKLNEMFMPTYLLGEYEMLERKERR